MQLGKHDRVDFLGVSFSSPDLVGHAYGPHSQEIQDMYAHLDGSIGGLLNALDRIVGPGQYALALSADHGVQRTSPSSASRPDATPAASAQARC